MILSRVPHIYHDTVYSKKMFEIAETKHLRIRNIYNLFSNFNDIDKSEGYLLDVLGGNFKILRNGLNDIEYRKLLKFEIALLQFLGSPQEIIRILSEYFKLNQTEFRIIELSGKILISIPEKLEKQQVFNLVKKIKGAGVGLEVINGIYVEDYLISELHEMTLEEIEKITRHMNKNVVTLDVNKDGITDIRLNKLDLSAKNLFSGNGEYIPVKGEKIQLNPATLRNIANNLRSRVLSDLEFIKKINGLCIEKNQKIQTLFMKLKIVDDIEISDIKLTYDSIFYLTGKVLELLIIPFYHSKTIIERVISSTFIVFKEVFLIENVYL